MKKFIIDVIVGARPNFMKAAALFAVADQFPTCQLRLIHTGQHYDPCLSDVFLNQFQLPKPHMCLNVGSAGHAKQTADIMNGYDQWVSQNKPDLCIVVGDVNSTVACALVSSKRGIPTAHVEAGLRSFDLSMPEEINRIVTDRISQLLFVTETSGVYNLKGEGRNQNDIHLVGNVMIDTLFRMKEKARHLNQCQKYELKKNGYAFLTLHRPSNVDRLETLSKICQQIGWTSERLPVVFPIHPRTEKSLKAFNLDQNLNKANVHIIEPLGYLESLSLILDSKVVITDSGGLQEETSALNIPCLTLRNNTERPVTIQKGTNTLICEDWTLYQQSVEKILDHTYPKVTSNIPQWDGQSAQRILKTCLDYLNRTEIQESELEVAKVVGEA